jgi:hypothetical protein
MEIAQEDEWRELFMAVKAERDLAVTRAERAERELGEVGIQLAAARQWIEKLSAVASVARIVCVSAEKDQRVAKCVQGLSLALHELDVTRREQETDDLLRECFDVLERLVDAQEGPPNLVPRHEEAWRKTMNDAWVVRDKMAKAGKAGNR